MTSKHKSEYYKLSAVEYYLVGDKSQLEVCEIFKCSPRSLMRWFEKYENRKPVAYKVQFKFLNRGDMNDPNVNTTIYK